MHFLLEIFGGMRKTSYLCTRQKVNRLFRLVVIDLGFKVDCLTDNKEGRETIFD